MAISTQLIASLAAGGGTSITAVTTPSLGFSGTYTWGESGKKYLVMSDRAINIAKSGNVGVGDSGDQWRVIPGPITFYTGNTTFLCIEVATN